MNDLQVAWETLKSWTIFGDLELLFLPQFRNNVRIIGLPMSISVFTDESETAVPNFKMKSNYTDAPTAYDIDQGRQVAIQFVQRESYLIQFLFQLWWPFLHQTVNIWHRSERKRNGTNNKIIWAGFARFWTNSRRHLRAIQEVIFSSTALNVRLLLREYWTDLINLKVLSKSISPSFSNSSKAFRVQRIMLPTSPTFRWKDDL